MPPRKYVRKTPSEDDAKKPKTKTALPTDDKDYTKVQYSDLKKGDYIMYEVKARTYKDKEYPAKVNQGFVSLIQNEVGDALWKDQDGKVLGMTNYGKSWTNNTKDIGDIYRQSDEANKAKRQKGLKKHMENAPARAEKRKVVAKVEKMLQEEDKDEAQKREQKPDELVALAKEISTEIKKSKRPAKKPRSSSDA